MELTAEPLHGQPVPLRHPPQHDRALTGRTVRQDAAGLPRGLYRPPMVRVRYLLTVWTAEPADEHRVLGDVLRLLAVSGEVPTAYLVGELRRARQPDGAGPRRRRRRAHRRTSGARSASPPRANLELVVTLPARRPDRDARSPAPPTELRRAHRRPTASGRAPRRVAPAAPAARRGRGLERSGTRRGCDGGLTDGRDTGDARRSPHPRSQPPRRTSAPRSPSQVRNDSDVIEQIVVHRSPSSTRRGTRSARSR